MRWWVAIGWAGCGSSAELKPGFERDIEQGWRCGEFSWVGFDERAEIRVEISVPLAKATFPDPGARFVVFTGEELLEPASEDPCDDRLGGEELVTEFLYVASAGTAERFPNGDRLGMTVEDIVLTPDPEGLGTLGDPKWEGLDDVELETFTFPEFGEP